MFNLQCENKTGSVSTATAESTDQPTNNPEMKLYEVSIIADVQMSLTGCVNVYAIDAGEASEKVQAKIDTETLDNDLEFEDSDSSNRMPYGDVKHIYDAGFQIDGGEVVEYPVDPVSVLETEVKELQASIIWKSEALAKHKAFLESLLTEDDDEEAVAA